MTAGSKGEASTEPGALIAWLEARRGMILTVPDGFWSSQAPDGRMIDAGSLVAILRALRARRQAGE